MDSSLRRRRHKIQRLLTVAAFAVVAVVCSFGDAGRKARRWILSSSRSSSPRRGDDDGGGTSASRPVLGGDGKGGGIAEGTKVGRLREDASAADGGRAPSPSSSSTDVAAAQDEPLGPLSHDADAAVFVRNETTSLAIGDDNSSGDSDDAATVLPIMPPFCGNFSATASSGGGGGACRSSWSHLRTVLRPTQQFVGFGWVARKIEKHFSSLRSAQEELNAREIPVVLGPSFFFSGRDGSAVEVLGRGERAGPMVVVPHVIDGHHTLAALEASGLDGSALVVTIRIVCDWTTRIWRTEDEFYDAMRRNGFLPPQIEFDNDKDGGDDPASSSALPSTVPGLVDDPFRSLASYARKVVDKKHCPKHHKHCHRCYRRSCDGSTGRLTAFFEFRWSDLFRRAYDDATLWDDEHDRQEFVESFDRLPTAIVAPLAAASSLVRNQPISKWEETAKALLPLCRGDAAGRYVVPTGAGGGRPLPGYVAGLDTVISEDDPDCASPECPTVP